MPHLHGQGIAVAAVPTSEFVTSIDVAGLTLGAHARDIDGNEYVFVQFSAASLELGDWVIIPSTNIVTTLSAGTVGNAQRVGIVVSAGNAASDYGWVQVYGINTRALVGSDVGSAAEGLQAFTSVGEGTVLSSDNSDRGIAQLFGGALTSDIKAAIVGVRPYSAADSLTSVAIGTGETSASHTSYGGWCSVFLNYPTVHRLEVTS